MITSETTASMKFNEEKRTMTAHIEIDLNFPEEMAKEYDVPGLMVVSEVSEDLWGAQLVAAALCLDRETSIFPSKLIDFALDALSKMLGTTLAKAAEMSDEPDDLVSVPADMGLCNCHVCQTRRTL